MSDSLIQEVAWKAATQAVSSLAMNDEQRKEAFAEIYRVFRLWLREYETRADRQHKHLHPPPSEK